MGAATTALYAVLQKQCRGDSPALIPAYFRAFRENLRQSLLLTLCLLPLWGLCIGYIVLTLTHLLPGPLQALCLITLVMIATVSTYVFPLQATFVNTVPGTLKNALLLPLSAPATALAVTTLQLLPVFLLLFHFQVFVRLSVLWLFLYGAGSAFCKVRLLNRQWQQAL